MLDPKHFQLLVDCDRYLERQHVLLQRLAAADEGDIALAAMESAFDQLLQAVTAGWQALADELDEGSAPDRGGAGRRDARPRAVDAEGHPDGEIA